MSRSSRRTARSPLGFDDLEPRRLLASIVVMQVGDTVQVTGTAENDTVIVNKDGNDLVIGGTTTHDGTVASLKTIQTAWGSAGSAAAGRAALQAGVGGVAINSSTVSDDGTLDFLFGNAGGDWFLANPFLDFVFDLGSDDFNDPI